MLKIIETKEEHLNKQYMLELSKQTLDEETHKEYANLQKTVKLNGFRPGKVPVDYLKKMYGQQVESTVLDRLVNGFVAQLVKDNNIETIGAPRLKLITEESKVGQSNLVFELNLDLMPEVPSIDFKTLTLKGFKLNEESAEQEAKDTLNRLADSSAEFNEKGSNAKVELKDRATLSFLGKINGVAFEGGQSDSYPLVIGSKSFIGDFEEQLIGLKQGDKKVVKVSFPATYQKAELANQPAEFDIEILKIESPKPTAIDAELAKRFGFETVEALTDSIKKRVHMEYEQVCFNLLKRSLFDQFEAMNIELPKKYIEFEAKQIAMQFEHEAHAHDHSANEPHDHSNAQVTEEHTKLAIRRVKSGIVVMDIAKKQSIQVSNEELSQAVWQMASRYPGQEKEFVEYLRNNPTMLEQIKSPIVENKVAKFIFEQATIDYKAVSKQDLLAEEEAIVQNYALS